jgi:hypothetical protein
MRANSPAQAAPGFRNGSSGQRLLNRRPRYHIAATILVSLFLGAFTERAMSCTDRVTEYIGKLDALFAQELESTIPFRTLNKAYFPLKSCDVDAISRVVGRSRYVRAMEKKPNAITVFVLSHGIIEVGFGYSTKKQSSELDYVRFKE